MAPEELPPKMRQPGNLAAGERSENEHGITRLGTAGHNWAQLGSQRAAQRSWVQSPAQIKLGMLAHTCTQYPGSKGRVIRSPLTMRDPFPQ